MQERNIFAMQSSYFWQPLLRAYLSCTIIFIFLIGYFCFNPLLNILKVYAIENAQETLGSQRLADTQEAFIKGIANRMHIQAPMIRKMNSAALQHYGYYNACILFPQICICIPVSSEPILFISEGFFEDLSVEEQEFLIGHELIHAKEQHTRYLALMLLLLFFSLVCIGLFGLRKLTFMLRSKIAPHYYLYSRIIIITGIIFLSGAIAELVEYAYRKHIEWVADVQSTQLLHSYQGGIKLMDRWIRDYKMP
jgi:Zn-dependent protease with chaperone function